jgi:ribosomal protein RSM22 (predicted rRNA methylase)
MQCVQVLKGSEQSENAAVVHVVAPCPHDGACPMQGTGSWCHFVQRFQRSSMQRFTKMRSDGGLARDYQV